jgi:hypothetical protein
MEKTIELPEDKSARAAVVDGLLADNWSIKVVPTDKNKAVITKDDLHEGASGQPELLLG